MLRFDWFDEYLSLGQEDIFRTQSSNVVKLRIMGYLSKSKVATEAFPSALQVSFDCLYGRTYFHE